MKIPRCAECFKQMRIDKVLCSICRGSKPICEKHGIKYMRKDHAAVNVMPPKVDREYSALIKRWRDKVSGKIPMLVEE